LKLYSAHSARRSLLDTVGFRALSQLATVVSYAVLVRGMSEQGFGVLNLLYSIIPIVSTCVSLGLDSTLRRFQPEFLRVQQRSQSAWLVSTVRRLRFFSTVAFLALLLLVWDWAAPWVHLAGYRWDFIIFSGLIVLHFQIMILQFSLASLMEHRYSVGSVAVVSITKLLAYAGTMYASELSLRNAILCDTFAYALGYAFLAFHYRRLQLAAPDARPQKPDGSALSRLTRFAGFSYLNDSASLLTFTETDRWFVAALMNPIAVGAYAFYTRLTDMVSSLVPMKYFDNVVQPLFFGVPKDEAREKIPRYFTLLINLNWVYQLPVIVFAVVYHHDIVAVAFGGKFIEHSWLLPVVVAFSASDNIISIPVTMVAQYKEKASIVLVSQAVGLYQVAAMLVLVPLFGLAGAATATGTFHLFRNLFVWWHVRHEAVWTNFRSFLGAALAIWGTAVWLCLTLREALHVPALLSMALGLVVCAAAALVHLRSPAVCDSDRRILANILHGGESRALKWVGLFPRGEAAAAIIK